MKSKLVQTLMIICLVVFAASCGDSNSSSETTVEGNDFLVTIKTDLGEMKAILHDETPLHKANFIKLANEGYFDSLLFHRVIKGFMIQGGDPDSRNATKEQRLGSGGPAERIPAEFVKTLFHQKGALSAARTGGPSNPEKESSGSQFYIVQGTVIPGTQLEGINQQKLIQAFQMCMQTQPDSDLAKEYQETMDKYPGVNDSIQAKVESTLERLGEMTGIEFSMPVERIETYSTLGGTPQLDGDYTVFGQVISGIEFVDGIADTPTAPGDRPVEDVRMYISVEEMPRAEIEKLFNYTYPRAAINQ